MSLAWILPRGFASGAVHISAKRISEIPIGIRVLRKDLTRGPEHLHPGLKQLGTVAAKWDSPSVPGTALIGT
jgi:hypothetical protein